jgi:coproporphyrinogen III oxidase-like Fe-S oxidoreductase
MISATLQDAGYRFIGMDHYVLPDDDLALAQGEGRLQRNFQGYSLRSPRTSSASACRRSARSATSTCRTRGT